METNLAEKLREAEASREAMRSALNAIPFPCPCCSYSTMHAESCMIGSALATNAGSELLKKLSDTQSALKSAVDCVINESKRATKAIEERDAALTEVERLRNFAQDWASSESQWVAREREWASTSVEQDKELYSLRLKVAAAEGMAEAATAAVAHADRRQQIAIAGMPDAELWRLPEPKFVALLRSALAVWQEANK